jgi:tungstate transport system ATP-binding protein
MRDDLGSPAALTFRNVSLRAAETMIVSDLSIRIDEGPPTIIMGPNGSGKTTLLKLAMGLVEPTDGTIMVAQDVRRGFVFQRPVMLRRSAADNVVFARTAADLPSDAGAVRHLLDVVGLAHVADRPARKLSGGEQQRLALARALARDPHVLFLDEPTASLDPAATKLIEDVIARVANSGVKVVMATHDLGQARRLAGDLVFIAKGRVVEHAAGSTFFLKPATEAARRFLAGDLVL